MGAAAVFGVYLTDLPVAMDMSWVGFPEAEADMMPPLF